MKRSLIRMAGVALGVALGGMLSAFAAVPSQSATFTVNGYKGASTLSNYPVLVRLSKAALTGGESATFSSDGADLRAYDASGNEIPHEIETWDPSGESAIWVRLPKLYGAISGTKTTFKLQWGGSPAARTKSDRDVWTAGYGIVLHGGLNASNKGIESVTATAPVAFGGTPTAGTSGAVAGNAVTFNHASSKGTIPASCFQSSSVAHGSTWLPLYVDPYNNGNWQPNWPFTISGWINISSCTDGTSNLIRLPFASGTKSALTVTVKNSSTLKFTITRSGSGTRDYSLDGASVKSGWVHLAISSFEYGDMVRVYVNGKALRGHCVSEYMMAEAEGAPLYFAEKMSGQLDELRITKQPQTPDCLLAEYETMADASFCTGAYDTPSATVTAPTITAPANGTVVSPHTPVMTEFVGYTPSQRTTKIGEEDFRAAAAYPEPYNTQPALTLLEWTGSSPSWTVHVYDVTDAANETEVTLVPTVVTANRLALGQLKSGRNYRWTVANTAGQTAEGTFSTADVTPCPIYVSGKIANCRDMGGWTGADGRRIRQGRVYRCSGFDDGKSPKTSFVDTESKRILVDVLGIKTDIDLREKQGVSTSQLGSNINYINAVMAQYGNWDEAVNSFKTVFAAFRDASKYPIAIHCQDGQDRTGCTQFILGALLGMSEADLMLDYYWSCYWKFKFNEENKKFPKFLEVLDNYSGADYAAKAVSWAKSRANVTDAQIATFREIMLEPAEEPDPHTEHTFGDWFVSKAPTFGATGVKTRICTHPGCGASETGIVPVVTVPSGCEAADYVETTGTQYIDTGVTISTNLTADLQFEYTQINTASGNHMLAAYRKVSDTNIYRQYAAGVKTNGKWYWGGWSSNGTDGDGWGTVPDTSIPAASANTPYHVVSTYTPNTHQLTVNGKTFTGTLKPNKANSNASLYLFARHNATSSATTAADYLSCAKLAYAHIYTGENGALAASFLPVRETATGAYKLYNPVSGALLAASGGDFAGPQSQEDPPEEIPAQSATFTVNGYRGASTLTDYPVLVRLSKAQLAGGASATFSSDGADLRASDADGNEIPHEIETWNPAGESAIWVRLPKLHGAIFGRKTTFRLTWGGTPSARTTTDRDVWSAGNYGLVLHGGLDAQGTGVDAVGGAAGVTFGGTHSEITSGAVAGRAVTFDNTSGKSTIPASYFESSSVAHGTTWLPMWTDVYGNGMWLPHWPFTFSGWINISSCTDGTSKLLSIPNAKNTANRIMSVTVLDNGTKLKFNCVYESDDETDEFVCPLDGASVKSGWVHLAISVWAEGDKVRVYLNGKALRGHYMYGFDQAGEGAPFFFAEGIGGQMDELRITRGPQDPDRLLAEYETMVDESFCTGVYGTPSAPAVTAPAITAPADGAVVSLHTPVMTEFLGYDAATRWQKFTEDDFRAGAAFPEKFNSHPSLTYLEWTGTSPSWEVHVYDVTDAVNETELKLPTQTAEANRIALGNLMAGRSYRWTVRNVNGQTAGGTFSTDDVAPRPIYVSGTIANCRDIGGWTGVDGRKIRQGLVYRTSGFDDGKLPDKTSFVDDDSRRILVDTLGIKTDIDLRSATNTLAGASPLGASLNVVSVRMRQYKDWDKSGEAFRAVLDAFLDSGNYPIAIHCQDGQDRTGCAMFVLGALLGIGEDDLLLDYMWSCFWKNHFGISSGDAQYEQFLSVLDGYAGANYAEKACDWAKKKAQVTDAEIAALRDILLVPAPTPTHVHAWVEASRIEPTCEAAGSVTSNCTGTGTCELGGTQVYALAALGHDLGDWYTYREPQVGVAGEERRECRREGCDHYESRALDPLPPPVVEPTERAVTAGAVTDGKLPLTFGAGTTDLLLFAVWGAADRGDNFYVKTGDDCWDGFTFVARIPAATTSYDFTLPDGWGTTVRYVRFFLTAVDGAPVSSLKSVSSTGGAAVLDTGYVPLPTATITAFVRTPAGTKNQTIFEVGTEGANNPYLVCNMYANADGNVAFNYRNSTKTSGWGCDDEHYDSEYKATTAVKSGEVMRWRIDGSRTKPLARYSDASGDYDAWDEGATTDKPTAPANGTVKFYGVGEITQATVMESTWTRYLMPSMVYDAAGNVVAGFYDSITHKTFASATAMPFTAGEADAYQRDLLNGVTLYGDSGTIEYTAPTPTEHVHTWTETKRVAATQMEDGYVTYACTGAGTCDAGGTKTETLRHTGKFDTLYKTLQTDGTGYILTDCAPANLKTARIEIKARRLNALSGFFFMANGNTAKLAGKTAGSGELGLAYWAGVQFADGKAPGLQYYCTPGNVIFGRDFGDTVWAHTYDAQGANLTMDDETYAISGTASTGAAGGPLALFCWTLNGTSASGIASLRVQSIRVWNGTTLVRDWVPVTKDGVATLYDKVNDKCETVRGGGTFSADNEVDPDYVDKPVNSWVREPSLTPNPFTAGVAPTFDLGEAAYGTPTATYAAERLAQLDGGVYTQIVAVAETDAYRGLETSIVFTVSGQLSREATVAPVIVAPTVGATVLTHTELQRAYLAKSDDERRAAYVDATYRQTLANGQSGPLPTALKWTGDGLTTVTVTRVTGTEKQFLRREVIGVRDAENELAIENLEIGTTYRWTVANGLGTATGTFTTDAEAPRLLRDPGPDTIRGIRDLGGRTGIDGRRVRQGLVFRSSQLGRETDASTYVNDVNRSFWTEFLGIRTELDFRSSSSEEAGGVTKSAIADSVQYRRCEIASYDFDSYDEYKAAFKLFLNEANYPIDFHCAAGQDRTGVFAFLLNALLGVSEDELQKDWEVTAFWNPSVDFCFANFDEFRANLRAAGGADAKTQAENFVINRLGLTTDDINTFRTIMLEPAEQPVDPDDPVGPSGEAFGTNAMANASWGYEIHGLGAASNEVALVFTNTAPAETMSWTVPDGVDKIWYLVVGGGGSGGNTGSNSNGAGGGGGGGGVLMNNAYSLTTPSSVLTITVGKGGKTSGGSQSQSTAGAKGGDSSLQVNSDSAIVAKGGGGGCSPKSGSNKSGGCGGGGAAATGDSWAASNANGGTGSQGGKGGNSAASSGQTTAIAGGGGGAGADGGDADSTNHRSGDGGIGVECLITGESEYYAGGGGGGAGYNATIDPKAGNGGKGGGGNGGDRTKTANTGAGKNATSFGGGGGGSGSNGTGEAYCGGSGYQGVVIIRYTRPQGEEPQTEKPKVDGKDVEPEAVFETATTAKPIVYPQGATVIVGGEVGAQTVAFGGKTVKVPRYYTATLATDGRTVALVLNDNAKPVFENEKGEVEKSGIVVASDGTVSLHLANVEPKLTYTLVASSSLDTPVENWAVIVSQKGAADFQDTSAKGDSRFYRVIVTDGE